MLDFSHVDDGTSWPNVGLQMSSNKSWKTGPSLPDKRRMLSKPGDFCTFIDLTTVWSSFQLKDSVLILSVSAILVFGNSCSSVVVEAHRSKF